VTVLYEERVFYSEYFAGETFDLRSRILFWRFDACVFVNGKILLDNFTQQLAFTSCTFEACNIDQVAVNEQRALIAHDNIFERPIAERKAEFDHRLAQALARRKAPSYGEL
jgi:hypothetical protein